MGGRRVIGKILGATCCTSSSAPYLPSQESRSLAGPSSRRVHCSRVLVNDTNRASGGPLMSERALRCANVTSVDLAATLMDLEIRMNVS